MVKEFYILFLMHYGVKVLPAELLEFIGLVSRNFYGLGVYLLNAFGVRDEMGA